MTNRLRDVVITRRSIDARQRKIKILLTLNAYIDEAAPESPIATPVNYSPVAPDAPKCIIVGAGPAGLFAALELIELGIKPIVLERGKDVDGSILRRQAVYSQQKKRTRGKGAQYIPPARGAA